MFLLGSETVKVKICCIQSREEIERAVSAGADALGFVSAMPSGPGVISEEMIARLIPLVPAGVESFLLSSLTEKAALRKQIRRLNPSTIQIVVQVEIKVYDEIRKLKRDTTIVQVIHVKDETTVTAAISAAGHVDALLLDSGQPDRRVKELGGTGRAHDWQISAEIVASVDVPVWLAGGLNAENVADAVRTVRLYGVDVCSGVRTGGRLDYGKLASFVAAVRSTDG